jgi:hypothetical protein
MLNGLLKLCVETYVGLHTKFFTVAQLQLKLECVGKYQQNSSEPYSMKICPAVFELL